MVVVLRDLDALQRDNRQTVEIVAPEAHEMVIGYGGPDLRSFDLTVSGFVPR